MLCYPRLKLGKVGGGKKRRKKIETKQLCRLINIRRWFFFTNITSRLSNRGIREITILFRRESSNFSHFSFGREKIRYGKERHAVLIRKENTRKKREKRKQRLFDTSRKSHFFSIFLYINFLPVNITRNNRQEQVNKFKTNFQIYELIDF